MIVIASEKETGAKELVRAFHRLQQQRLIQLEDAATVIYMPGGKPMVEQCHSLVGSGVVHPGFWNTLLARFVLFPWQGPMPGGSMRAIGIDEDFLIDVANTMEPQHSALLLLVSAISEEEVMGALSQFDVHTFRTTVFEDEVA